MRKLPVKDLTAFAMMGALMFVSTLLMKALPNIHLLAVFIISFTRVYRARALIPIYIYVLLEGVWQGFSPWWVPYLYIWTVLWAVVMLLPRQMPLWLEAPLYCVLGAVHGLSFGTLWAPMQALLFGLSFQGTVAWVIAGLPFDVTHAISNATACLLCVPLIKALRRISRQ